MQVPLYRLVAAGTIANWFIKRVTHNWLCVLVRKMLICWIIMKQENIKKNTDTCKHKHIIITSTCYWITVCWFFKYTMFGFVIWEITKLKYTKRFIHSAINRHIHVHTHTHTNNDAVMYLIINNDQLYVLPITTLPLWITCNCIRWTQWECY